MKLSDLFSLISRRDPRLCPHHVALQATHKVLGRRFYHRSRWKPHQGKRECARRLAKGIPAAG